MPQKTPPLKRNDEIELTVDAFGSEGQGIGRYDGFAVFVPFALPGETVRVHIIKATASYAIGKLLSISVKSPCRAEPKCSHFGRCGGCTLMHLDYEAQLMFKRDMVASALTRIGGLMAPEMREALGMQFPYFYRNKGSFPFANLDGRVSFGFFAPRSHRLIPLSDCSIQEDKTLLVAEAVCDWANQFQIPAYDETLQTGTLRHVMARVSAANGEVMAAIVTKGKLPQKEVLIEHLRNRIPGLVSILHNRNDAETNVIFGPEFSTLWGKDRLYDTICGLRFAVSAASFLQVNPQQTEVLYHAALNALQLEGTERVADVYCGIGTISLLLARHAAQVDGIETVPEAIADAIFNAQENAIKNVEFHCGNAEDVLPQLVREGYHPDAVLIDPPRKGCERPVLDALLACGAKRLVYVSCNPSTLARDVRVLVDGGFRFVYAQPVDMFPQTAHVETVVLLSHKKPDGHINVKVEFGEGEGKVPLDNIAKRAESYKPKERVTYKMIKEYIEAKYGFKVHTAYIAEVKRDLGLPMYDAPNAVEELKQPRKHPTAEKVEAIKDALKHFEVI